MNFAGNVPSLPPYESSERVGTLFISDVHLGTRGCQAEKLLHLRRIHDADVIYLVGDIVDGWQLKSGWYWPQSHNDVAQKLLRKSRKGTRLVYIPGTFASSERVKKHPGFQAGVFLWRRLASYGAQPKR